MCLRYGQGVAENGLTLCHARCLPQMNETYDAYGQGLAQPAYYFQKQVRIVCNLVKGMGLCILIAHESNYALYLSRICHDSFLKIYAASHDVVKYKREVEELKGGGRIFTHWFAAACLCRMALSCFLGILSCLNITWEELWIGRYRQTW